MDTSQQSSPSPPPQTRTRKPLPQRRQQQLSATSINYSLMITQLNQTINRTYQKLQNCYQNAAAANQSYLLKSYLKILDRVLDQLLYAQERVQMVDGEHILDQKCLHYGLQINQYRQQCYRAKTEVLAKKEQLKNQKHTTQKLMWDRNNMLVLCTKKDRELQLVKEIINSKQTYKEDKKRISTIMEDNQKQQENPQLNSQQKQKKSISNKNTVKNNLFTISVKNANKTFQTTKVQMKPKSQSINFRTNRQFDSGETGKKNNSLNKLQYYQKELLPQLNDNLGSPLWLYRPNFRKNKFIRGNFKQISSQKLQSNNKKDESYSNKESSSTSQGSYRKQVQCQKFK